MGRFTPAKAAKNPRVQSAMAELQEALAPFQRVVEAYGKSQPAADHAVLRVHGPNGARAEVRFGDFLRLTALLGPQAHEAEEAVAETPASETGVAEDASDEGAGS